MIGHAMAYSGPAAVAILLAAGPLLADARIARYVEAADSDPDTIAIGYAVPQARAQSQPFAGFRSLSGINLRMDELALQPDGPRLQTVAQSTDGQDIRELCFGPPDQPPQVLITGGIHAREWASPEAVLGLAESLTLQRGAQPLIDWLARTRPLCLVPVLNPDGFTQTQNEFDRTRICEAPETPDAQPDCVADTAYPRDGRMRRKNLRASDGDLTTAADALQGVDLNRNLPPFWATRAGASSSNEAPSILYHGPAAGSEPEVAWLIERVANAARDQFRLYVDVHSFSRLYFWNCTGSRRLDLTADDWVNRMRLAARQAYANVPTGNPSTGAGCGTFGIGATDELFAFEAGAPAYTLELEPGRERSASEYGGLGVSHDGFLLPEAIVPAMRQDATQMLLLGATLSAGPPWVPALEVRSNDGPIYIADWSTGTAQRTLDARQLRAPQPGEAVALHVTFDRPMRWLVDGNVAPFPGRSAQPALELAFVSGAQRWPVDVTDGQWETAPEGFGLDQFRVSAVIPADWNPQDILQLELSGRDAADVALDADPATPAVWRAGGFDGIEGGTDRRHILAGVAPTSSGGSGSSLGLLLLIGAAVGIMRRRVSGVHG